MFRARLEPRVNQFDPVFDMIVDAIRANKPIIYSKINHGFWERLVAIESAGYSIDEQNPLTTKAMDTLEGFQRSTPHMFEGGFVTELVDILRSIPKNKPDYIFAASLLAWPGRLEIAGLGQDETASQTMMKRLIPMETLHQMADGMEIKRAMINGTFVDFANVLKTRKTLLVGNANLTRYLEFIGAENGRFLEIHPTDARGHRREILEDVLEIIEAEPDTDIILLQAGGSLSAWLAYHINKAKPQVSLIDIGLGSLICKPDVLLKTAFGRVYREQLIACIHDVNPSWINDNYEKLIVDETFTGRSNETSKYLKSSGVAYKLSSFDPEITFPDKVPFEFAKPLDEARMKQIIDGTKKPSEMAVSVLKQLMGLSRTDEIVLCQSRQGAFELASKIIETEHGGQKPWIVDPFFETTSQFNVHRIDSTESGLMSRDIIRARDLSSNSGVIFSNLFGGAIPAWNRIRNFSTKLGFSLIIDNQNGFLDRPKTKRPSSEIEIVSATASKPWGIHELAILIVSKQRAQLARSIIQMEEAIPERQCAEWIDHLERYPHWSFFYFRQAQRLRQIISRNLPDFSEYLLEFPSKSPVGTLQYLCPKPIKEERMENDVFEIRKALRSVPSNFDHANFLSEHLISIPCHPFMRNVSKESVKKSLQALT